MDRSLPSMQWLQTFEATARHASLLRASEELCLTPSALSKQIQALELQLGTRLFERYNRKLVLTAAGAQYLVSVREALSVLAQATGRLRRDSEPDRLHLLAPPYFSAYWLLPNLQSFRARYPDIALSIGSFSKLECPDFDTLGADAAIVLGSGDWPASHVVEPLLHNYYLAPMCAPSLLPDGKPFDSVTAMASVTWLKPRNFPQMWDFWLEHDPLADTTAANVIWFDNPQELTEAACQGLGIAMMGGAANMRLPDMLRQRLTLAHNFHRISDCFSYNLIIPRKHLGRRDIRALQRWVRELFPAVRKPRMLALAA